MPGWLIDLFGSRQIQNAFLLITIAPLPVWAALLFFPRRPWARFLSSPFLAPPILSLLYLYMVWNVWEVGAPEPPEMAARSVRGYVRHPLIFLVLWSHLQVANLFVATVIRDDAHQMRIGARFELTLCWLFAPAAVLVYTLRRLWRQHGFPWR